MNENNVNKGRLDDWLFAQSEGYNEAIDKFRLIFLLDYIKTNFPIEKGHNKILDVGCGSGIFVKELKRLGYDVIGIDNHDIVKHVSDKEKLNLVTGDAHNLPFQDNSFDYILCFEVLEHIPDCGKAIQEIHRCLKKDGVFLATMPNLFCFDSIEGTFKIISSILTLVNKIRRTFGLKNIYDGGYSTHVHKFFPPRWKKTINKNNFNVTADYPVFVSIYLPNALKKIKQLEWWIYNFETIIKLQFFLSKSLRVIPLLKYTGQTHLFVSKPV